MKVYDFNTRIEDLLEMLNSSSATACSKRSAWLDLEAVAVRELKKLNEEEHRQKIVTLGFVIDMLHEFITDRKNYRNTCSTGGLSGSDRDDADFAHLFQNFVRHKLKLFAP